MGESSGSLAVLLRWEVFALSLQDYAMLSTLGVGPEDGRLADLRGFDDFPKQARWHADAVRSLLSAARGRGQSSDLLFPEHAVDLARQQMLL